MPDAGVAGLTRRIDDGAIIPLADIEDRAHRCAGYKPEGAGQLLLAAPNHPLADRATKATVRKITEELP